MGIPEAPIRLKPPLSRSLVFAIDELTSAWIPDIVAIVNITRAMLARVAPVRNFLFIGYAIAVRTTGSHVRRRTSRVARARIESLLNSTTSRPPNTSRRPAALNRLRDIPDRAHDVQLGHPPGSNRDGRHGDEEPDGESVDQVRVRPREDEPGATERTGAEDLRESPEDYGRDEESHEGAHQGGEQRVEEALRYEALKQIRPAHPERSGDAHLAFPLLREHDEDVDDQEDSRDDREESEQDKHLAQLVDVPAGSIVGVRLRFRNREGGSRGEERRHLPDHVVRPKVALGHAAHVGDRDRVDLAALSQGSLKAGQGEEEILPIVPRAAAYILDDLPHRYVAHETAGAADVQDKGVPRL